MELHGDAFGAGNSMVLYHMDKVEHYDWGARVTVLGCETEIVVNYEETVQPLYGALKYHV